MNLLLYCEIAENLPIPDFGSEFKAHIAQKHHPQVHAASLTAWNLLAHALKRLGLEKLPAVHFEAAGKPVFINCPLYLSISHSGNMAAALVSHQACAVDIEAIRPSADERMIQRCLSAEEGGMDFFECWTKKECIGKLSGAGIPSRPSGISSLNPEYAERFHICRIFDSVGQEYVLAALCSDKNKPVIEQYRFFPI